MCDDKDGNAYLQARQQAQGQMPQQASEPSEIALAKEIKRDLGVEINPQALRMFLHFRWPLVAKLAHRIHEGS